VLLVDGDTVLASRSQLAGATVKVKLVGDARGPKITGFTYKPKSNQRRHYGHRQDLSIIEVTAITKGRSKSSSKAKADAAPADESAADATPAEADSTEAGA
jgi:hypothetical protein